MTQLFYNTKSEVFLLKLRDEKMDLVLDDRKFSVEQMITQILNDMSPPSMWNFFLTMLLMYFPL